MAALPGRNPSILIHPAIHRVHDPGGMIDLSRVDLNLLVVFDALMAERQVTRAAAQVRLTQPAVSHALRRLRHLFDDELFTRGPGGMQPTQRAQDLHVPVRAALAHVRAALGSRTSFDPATARRRFRLAMTEVMTLEVLPRLVSLVRQRAPGVDLAILGSGAGEAGEMVAAGAADIGLGVLPQLPDGLLSQELYTDCSPAWWTAATHSCATGGWGWRTTSPPRMSPSPGRGTSGSNWTRSSRGSGWCAAWWRCCRTTSRSPP